MNDHYILDGKTPVKTDLMTWARWFESADNSRIVAKTAVGDQSVSTVFLGLDHSFGGGPPLLFETMIFGGHEDQEYQTRCSTWVEAEAMHAAAVAHAKSLLN